MSLLSELLEACYYRAHPEEKTAPCEFDWNRVSPQNLRAVEHKRKQKKPGGKCSPAKAAAAQQRYRDRKKAQIGEAAFNAARAAEQLAWAHSENGVRYTTRQSELSYSDARKQAEKAKRLASRLATVALADLEAPSYVVIAASGKATIESWPLRDEAAAVARRPPPHRGHHKRCPQSCGHQPREGVEHHNREDTGSAAPQPARSKVPSEAVPKRKRKADPFDHLKSIAPCGNR